MGSVRPNSRRGDIRTCDAETAVAADAALCNDAHGWDRQNCFASQCGLGLFWIVAASVAKSSG
jgi:hypothetical protein